MTFDYSVGKPSFIRRTMSIDQKKIYVEDIILTFLDCNMILDVL